MTEHTKPILPIRRRITPYLVIDADYGIYQAETLSGELRSAAMRGEVSIVHTITGRGMDRDGRWSDLPVWAGFCKQS